MARSGIGKKSNAAKRTSADSGPTTRLIKVLSGQYTERYTETLHDLVTAGNGDGARLDELCSLKVNDVTNVKTDGGSPFVRARPKAALREFRFMTARGMC